MNTEPHCVNGVVIGAYHTLEDGRVVYLAYRRNRDMHRQKQAWCIDAITVRRLKERGIETVGVLVQTSKEHSIWLTHIDDFYHNPHAFKYTYKNARQLGLPLATFRVRPDTKTQRVARAMKLSTRRKKRG